MTAICTKDTSLNQKYHKQIQTQFTNHFEIDYLASLSSRISIIHSYTSRFLNKSKSSAVLPPDDDPNNTGDDSDSKYGTGRSRYLALKERRNLLARSRSSHLFGNDDDDGLDEPVSPTTASPSAYLASRCAKQFL